MRQPRRRVATVNAVFTPDHAGAPSIAAMTSVALARIAHDLHDCSAFSNIVDVLAGSARRSIGADGATVVLRESDRAHYVGEDAISALWKGQSFPIGTCLSGWSMIHREQVIVPDIRLDARIPLPLYTATFVRSMMMTPVVRDDEAVAALGVYWAHHHAATDEEQATLREIARLAATSLADPLAVHR